MNKRVKIVATLGPAVEIRGGKKFGEDGYWGEKLDVEASAQNIAKLIEAGANTFRFNFSHGDHQEQGERMATVKLAEKLAGKKVGFLLDTKAVSYTHLPCNGRPPLMTIFLMFYSFKIY